MASNWIFSAPGVTDYLLIKGWNGSRSSVWFLRIYLQFCARYCIERLHLPYHWWVCGPLIISAGPVGSYTLRHLVHFV